MKQLNNRKDEYTMTPISTTLREPFAMWWRHAFSVGSPAFAELASFMGSKVVFDGMKDGAQ